MMNGLQKKLRNGVLVSMVLLVAGTSFGATILTDSFDDPGAVPHSVKVNSNIANRQTGSIATSTWSENGGTDTWRTVLKPADGSNTAQLDASLGLYSDTAKPWVAAWNDYNFAAQTGQILTYRIDASVMTSGQIGAIVIGPAAAQSATAGSISVTLDPTGAYSIYDGATSVASGNVGAAQWTAVSISLNDTGAGTVAGVSIGGSSVLASHSVATTLTDRYYTLGDLGSGGPCHLMYDDLNVSAIPEPATMALLAMGGCGVLLRRRRG